MAAARCMQPHPTKQQGAVGGWCNARAQPRLCHLQLCCGPGPTILACGLWALLLGRCTAQSQGSIFKAVALSFSQYTEYSRYYSAINHTRVPAARPADAAATYRARTPTPSHTLRSGRRVGLAPTPAWARPRSQRAAGAHSFRDTGSALANVKNDPSSANADTSRWSASAAHHSLQCLTRCVYCSFDAGQADRTCALVLLARPDKRNPSEQGEGKGQSQGRGGTKGRVTETEMKKKKKSHCLTASRPRTNATHMDREKGGDRAIPKE
jgi:hypothetical protein